MNGLFRRLRLAFLFAALATLPACDSDSDEGDVGNTDFVASSEFSYDIGAAGLTTLRLEAVNGEVSIRAEAGVESVLVEGEKRVGSESIEDASDYLSRLSVTVAQEGDRVIAKTTQPEDNGGRLLVVDYDVVVPEEFVVDVTQANGVIVLENIHGDAFVQLANGTIDADVTLSPGGEVDMVLANGTIDVSIPSVTSADVVLAVANGSVAVVDLDLTDVTSTSTSLAGRLGSGDGDIRLAAANGQIVLRSSD